jgi:hypothetical protein
MVQTLSEYWIVIQPIFVMLVGPFWFLIGAIFSALLGYYVYVRQKRREMSLTIFTEFCGVEFHNKRREAGKAYIDFIKEMDSENSKNCVKYKWQDFRDYWSKEDSDKDQAAVFIAQFFERVVLLYEGNFLDRKMIFVFMHRHFAWWNENVFTKFDVEEQNNAIFVAKRIDKIINKHVRIK